MSNIIKEVKELQLPLGKYSVVGSGALSVRNIRQHSDIDLIVTEEIYEKLKKGGWEEREKKNGFFHIYKDNAEAAKNFLHIEGCDLNTTDVIKNSDIINGVPFMSLAHLIKLKQTMGRDKDLDDINDIKKYLEKQK